MSTAPPILYETNSGVARITINHPERLNALDDEDWLTLAQAFERADADPEIGVIVLTGAGDRSFCAGGYLKNVAEVNVERSRRLYRNSGRLFNAMRKARQPVIGRINGYAIGGGNEILIHCDLAVAAEHAKLGQVGPKIGSVPIWGATNLHALNIGEKRAKEMVFLCQQFTAQEALELGWINKVVPYAELDAAVDAWCEELLDKSPLYLELAKVSANAWWDMMQPAITHGEQFLMKAAGTPQNVEGARAFMEKRPPNWRQFRKPESEG
ncbi:MAG: enoyl-CoA hydratase/isomerase family protein [Caulobacterales bacterium]